MKIGTDNLIKTGTTRGKGRLKRYGIAAALSALALGLCTFPPTVRAAEMRAEESEQDAAWAELSSKGNLVYCEEEKAAQIYATDFLLLKDKLDTIPHTIFESALYTHTHRWEYLNVNGETHTRHCESCGAAFDLVDAHRAERSENCTLSYGGAEYPGIRFTCACGYRWEREESHTLLYESVDETCHRNRCCLSGTPFCPGYEPVTEEHYAYHYIPCEDGCHHERVCMDCGYRAVEECCFSLSDPDSDEENGSENGIRQCWCGNVEKSAVDTESGEDSSDTETGDPNAGVNTEEDSSDAETGDPNAGVNTEEDSSDTETGDPNAGVNTEEDSSDTEIGGEAEISEAVEDPSEAETGEENRSAEPETETPVSEAEKEMPDTEAIT